MGFCYNCSWVYKDTFNWKCSYLDRVVDAYGSCNHFSERATSENSGYHGSSSKSGCYLTSACCEYLGKEDDCAELTALRKIRDEFLMKTEDGKKLVEEYYAIAPKIIKGVEESGEKELYYMYIYGVIMHCIEHIQAQELEKAKEEYVQMATILSKKLL